MEIFLTKQCQALTGSLGKGYGYHIQRRKNGFFAKRNSNGEIPADGHLRFIFACAQLAQMKTHIIGILVSAKELRGAFDEAHFLYGDRLVKADAKQIYNAPDVLDFKKWCSL